LALASPHTLVTLSTHSPYTLLTLSSHSSHTPLLIACASCLPSVQVMRALMISKWQALGSKKGPEKGIAAARKMANTWMSKVLGRELQVCVCVCVCVRLWATSCRAHLTLASWWLVRARKLQARCRTVAHEMPLIFLPCNSSSLAHALSQEAQDDGASMHGGASTPRVPEAYAKVLKVPDPPFPAKQLGQSNRGKAANSQATQPKQLSSGPSVRGKVVARSCVGTSGACATCAALRLHPQHLPQTREHKCTEEH